MRRVLIGSALILSVAYLALTIYGVLQLNRARRLVKAVEELPAGYKRTPAQSDRPGNQPIWTGFSSTREYPPD